jgi:predicted Zn-ribbon and HTH transcriptional regulator
MEFIIFPTRHARKILREGGPKTAKEYFFIFPLACRSCGGRDIEHTRIVLNRREFWNLYGGFYEHKDSGWKEWIECRKCGCTYNVNESVYFATNYPRYKNKNIEKFGPSSFIGLSNRNVNWDKLKKEGFNRNEIPEKIP